MGGSGSGSGFTDTPAKGGGRVGVRIQVWVWGAPFFFLGGGEVVRVQVQGFMDVKLPSGSMHTTILDSGPQDHD